MASPKTLERKEKDLQTAANMLSEGRPRDFVKRTLNLSNKDLARLNFMHHAKHGLLGMIRKKKA